MKKYFLPFFILLLLFFFPFVSKAVRLYLEPQEGRSGIDSTFITEILLDTEQENINAIEIGLKFPPEILEASDFSQGNSIVTLWLKKPSFSNTDGTVSLAGGMPGGYQGSKGLIGRIILKAKKKGTAKINFEDYSQVLLNDGKGTKASLATNGANINILAKETEISEDKWKTEVGEDIVPPELFEAEINQDPLIFEGRFFLTFTTTDKQTGVDHYEVKEGDRPWKAVESPYVLENQNLNEEIMVKSIDKAGNERLVTLALRKPEEKIISIKWLAGIIIVLVSVIIITIAVVYKKLRF